MQVARRWDTKVFKGLLATHWVDIDQCDYALNVDGQSLNMNPCRVATNKPSMCKLQKTNSGDHSHVRLLGRNRGHVAENYPEESVALIMAAPETFDGFDDVFPIDHDWDMTVDTNEPRQVGEPAEPTVEDGRVTTEKKPSEVTQRHGTSERSYPCPHTSQYRSARGGSEVRAAI